jgi:protein involved in polysaccharide export with SLBB domain
MAGPTELSDLSQAHVLRGNEVLPLNLESIALAKPDEKVQSFKLKNGDTLFIPMIKTKFSVLGAVGRPGVFPLPATRPIKVLDAFNLAGGGPQADLAKAGIVRLEGAEYKIIKVNIEAMLKKGDMSGNIPIKDSDILYIQAKGRGGFKLEDLLTPLYLFRYLIP